MSKAPALVAIERPAVDRSLTKSAYMGNLSRVRELLEPAAGKASDIAEKDIYGCTALTWAARNGSSDVLKYLLAREGDVESVSYGGFKPVHHACNLAKEATLREVIAAGCNVSSTDEAGNTALHWAAARGVLNLVLVLLEAGAKIDERNNTGATALHRAANNGHVNVVSALLKEGASAGEADDAGNTPLHSAASAGFDAVVKVLLAGGARSTVNRAGKTPADVATTSAVKSELDKA